MNLGMKVIASANLPIVPDLVEDTRRAVRHGLSDVLEWLGQPVGPRPGELVHVLMYPPDTIAVSAEFLRELEAPHASDS